MRRAPAHIGGVEHPIAPLAYDRSGNGIPVVLLHGLTFDRGTWRPIIDRLGGRVLSVALDLPGHGESGGSPLRIEDLAALIRTQLDALGIHRPVVVGHSMLGGLALSYAAQHPARGAVAIDNPPDIREFATLAHRLEPALRSEQFSETFHNVCTSRAWASSSSPTTCAAPSSPASASARTSSSATGPSS